MINVVIQTCLPPPRGRQKSVIAKLMKRCNAEMTNDSSCLEKYNEGSYVRGEVERREADFRRSLYQCE